MESMLAQAARRIGLRRPSYERFISQVEPALLSRPRVHRFGAVPQLAEPTMEATRLAVRIDPAGGGDAALTRASLERQTVRAEPLTEDGPDWVVHVRAGDRLSPLALE